MKKIETKMTVSHRRNGHLLLLIVLVCVSGFACCSAGFISAKDGSSPISTKSSGIGGESLARQGNMKREIDHSDREFEEEINNLPTCSADARILKDQKAAVSSSPFARVEAEEPHLMSSLRKDALSFCKSKYTQSFKDKLQSDGKFSDLEYTTDKNVIRTHARRLCSLVREELFSDAAVRSAKGFTFLLSKADIRNLERTDVALSEKVLESFRYLTCTAPPPPDTNWWQHSIGTPSYIWNAAVLAGEYLPGTLQQDYMDRWFLYGEEGAVWKPFVNESRMAGANLASRMFLSTVYSALSETLPQFVDEASKMLRKEIIDYEGFNNVGIRPDGCLHQHNLRLEPNEESPILGQPYGNNYGKEFYRMVSRVMWLLHDSTSPFPSEVEQAMVERFLGCQMYFHRGKTVEPSTAGRFVDSGKLITKVGSYHGIYQTATFLRELNYRTSDLDGVLARYKKAVPFTEYALTANKFFFSSDIMVHHRQGYFASLRMTSTRTLRPESFTTTNPLGYYQGDGWFSLLVSAEEFGVESAEVFQVYDWTKIPGVTCEQKAPLEIGFYQKYVEHFYNNASFVGGVSDGQLGLSAMVLDRSTTEIKAKKSWFFFSDSIVALGSDIIRDSNEVLHQTPVATTINQVMAAESFFVGLGDGTEEEYSFVDGSEKTLSAAWLHHDGTGYVFPLLGNKIYVKTATETISGGSDLNVFIAWMDHSQLPLPSIYSFTYLPSATVEQTRQFSQDSPLKTIKQDSQAHAVCHSKDKVIGIALWEASCTDISLCLPTTDNANVTTMQFCSDVPILLMLSATLPQNEMAARHSGAEKMQKSDEPVIARDDATVVEEASSLCNYVTAADPQQKHSSVLITMRYTKTDLLLKKIEKTITLPTGNYKGSSVSTLFCT